LQARRDIGHGGGPHSSRTSGLAGVWSLCEQCERSLSAARSLAAVKAFAKTDGGYFGVKWESA